MHRFVLILLSISTLVPQAFPVALRTHYVVVHKDMTPAYEVTRIHISSEAATKRTFLIADAKAPLVRIEETYDWAGHKRVTQYTLLRDSHATARITVDMPYAATTESGVRGEIKNRPELRSATRPVTIEGPAGRVLHANDSDWYAAGFAETRRQGTKDAVGPDVLSLLSDLRDLAGLPPFADLNTTLGYVFGPESLVYKSPDLMVATTKPDCRFDAKFGTACEAK